MKNTRKEDSIIGKIFSRKNLFKKASFTGIIATLVLGMIAIPDKPYKSEIKKEQETFETKVPKDREVLTEDALRKAVINNMIDDSKIGYHVKDLNMELRVPIESGKKYKTEQLDANGNPVKVLDERTGIWEPQYVVKREKVDQIIKVDHGSGVLRFPGNPDNAYLHFDMPVSYMDKVMVNIQSFFYEQVVYCEYQGSNAEYLVNNKDTIWKDRDIEHCLNWENIKYRLSTHIGPRTELIDVDGEHRYVYEPSQLNKILSHFVNFAVECGVISNENFNKLLHGDEDTSSNVANELSKSTHHSSPNYALDAQEIIESLLKMKIIPNKDSYQGGYDFYAMIPVSVPTKTTIQTEFIGVHLACDRAYNLTRVELPGYENQREENCWETIKLSGGDLKLKIDATFEAKPVKKPNIESKILNSYTPLIDSLSLYDSILKFVTKPKIKYKTDITIDHVVNGPAYSQMTDGDGNPVDFYNPNETIDWYKSQGIDVGTLRKGDDPRNIMETAYINIDGATNFGEGIKFTDILSTVATEMGYNIDIGIVEDETDRYGQPMFENGQKKRKRSMQHHLLYSWDKAADNGKGMNYFEYQGVAKYKANFVDFNKLLGKINHFTSKFFDDGNTKERTKADFWKYVDALGESNFRRTLGLLVDNVFTVINDPDYAASIKAGNVKDLTDIITKVEAYKDGSGGETVLDFAPIGLKGRFILKVKNKSYPGYTVADANHPTPVEGLNDKFEWVFDGIEVGGFEINGSISLIGCNEDDKYFLDKYVKIFGPQSEADEKTYQPIKYFNDVVDQLFSLNENRQLALKLDAKAMEDESRGNTKAGFDLISRGAVAKSETGSKDLISWSEFNLLKYSPTFRSADLEYGRSGGRAQEFKLDLDIIEKTKNLVLMHPDGQPILDSYGKLQPVYKPGTKEPIKVVDTEESNVFIRLGSTTSKGRAREANNRLNYHAPRRCYVDKHGDIDHPIEGWASIQAYVDLYELCKSVLQKTPDKRFSKFTSLLSTDVQASTTLDSVVDKVKNGNIINPLLSTKIITKIVVGPDDSMIFGINKELGGGKLLKDIEITVSTKKHVFQTAEEEQRYRETHPDHEPRDVSGIRITTKLARNKLADGLTSYDGLDIDIKLSIEDYFEKVNGRYTYKVEDNFRFTKSDRYGHGPHDIRNENYMDFSTVEYITQSALNTAWLGSGARYFKENGHIDLRKTMKNNKQVRDTANLLGLSAGDIISNSEQVGPSTYHIRLRFNELKGQFIFNVSFKYLSMDFWIYMQGDKCRIMTIINMPIQQGFNDQLSVPFVSSTYYGGGKLGSESVFVKSMILYEVGYTPKSQWTDIDKKLNRDTGKVYMFRSYRETNAKNGWRVDDYRVTTGYFFRRHIQEWMQFYILGDHYQNGGLQGKRPAFQGKPVYPGEELVDKSGNTGFLNSVMYPEDILSNYSFRVDEREGDEIKKCTWDMGINYHDLVSFDMNGLKTGYYGDQTQKDDGPIKINLTGVASYLKHVKFAAGIHPMKFLSSYVWADFDGYLDLYNLDYNGNYTNCWTQRARDQYVFTGSVGNATIGGLFDEIKNYCDATFVMTPIPWCNYNSRTGKFERYTYPDDYTRNGRCWVNRNGQIKLEGGQNASWREFADWSAKNARGTVHY